MINFGRVTTNIFVGNAPQNPVDVTRLTQMRVTAVLSLQSDHDLKAYKIDWRRLRESYRENQITARRCAITDFSERDLAKKLPLACTELSQLIKSQHRVYVHCNAGICRAPATVLTYLCSTGGMTLAAGLELIRQERPQANPYTGAVLKALDELALTPTISPSNG